MWRNIVFWLWVGQLWLGLGNTCTDFGPNRAGFEQLWAGFDRTLPELDQVSVVGLPSPSPLPPSGSSRPPARLLSFPGLPTASIVLCAIGVVLPLSPHPRPIKACATLPRQRSRVTLVRTPWVTQRWYGIVFAFLFAPVSALCAACRAAGAGQALRVPPRGGMPESPGAPPPCASQLQSVACLGASCAPGRAWGWAAGARSMPGGPPPPLALAAAAGARALGGTRARVWAALEGRSRERFLSGARRRSGA